MPIVRIAFTASQLYARDVFLLERITAKRERMPQLQAIIFVRPSPASLDAIEEELRSPNYNEYRLVFSNHVSRVRLDRLAEQDKQQAVISVTEVFADFYAAAPNLFSLNMFGTSILHDEQRWDQRMFDDMCNGICASLLAFKTLPTIRFAAKSPLASRIAEEINVCCLIVRKYLTSYRSCAYNMARNYFKDVRVTLQQFCCCWIDVTILLHHC